MAGGARPAGGTKPPSGGPPAALLPRVKPISDPPKHGHAAMSARATAQRELGKKPRRGALWLLTAAKGMLGAPTRYGVKRWPLLAARDSGAARMPRGWLGLAGRLILGVTMKQKAVGSDALRTSFRRLAGQ